MAKAVGISKSRDFHAFLKRPEVFGGLASFFTSVVLELDVFLFVVPSVVRLSCAIDKIFEIIN